MNQILKIIKEVVKDLFIFKIKKSLKNFFELIEDEVDDEVEN